MHFSILDKTNAKHNGKIFDVELAAYLLNPSATSYDISRLAQEYNADEVKVEIDNDNPHKELALNIAQLTTVANKIEQKITDNGQITLLNDIEIPLANVLASMENQGFMADRKGIEILVTALVKGLLKLNKTSTI